MSRSEALSKLRDTLEDLVREKKPRVFDREICRRSGVSKATFDDIKADFKKVTAANKDRLWTVKFLYQDYFADTEARRDSLMRKGKHFDRDDGCWNGQKDD
jgi:hypothetical protein